MKNPYYHLIDHIGKKLTYEEFCKLIDEPVQTIQQNKSRQLKNLRNFFDFTNSKGHIIIKGIYDVKQLFLLNKKGKFTEYIEDLLIEYLATCGEKAPTLTYKDMIEYLFMANENYYISKYNQHDFVESLEYETSKLIDDPEIKNRKAKDVGYFYLVTNKLMREIVRNALVSLKHRSLILYHDTFKLYKTIYIPKTDSYITQTFLLNQQEREKFLDLRERVMKKHNMRKTQNIFKLEKEEREFYFTDLLKELSECKELHYADRYANAFTIEYGEKGIEHEYKRLKSTNRRMINYNMQQKLMATNELNFLSDMFKEELINKLIDVCFEID